jgi:penicillin amidase
LLRSTPGRWTPEDSVLCAFSMYLSLNDSSGAAELARSQLRESLPPQFFAFMHPLGTEWDAPIVGGMWRPPSVPGPEVFDLRSAQVRAAALASPPSRLTLQEEPVVGSNSWVVAGSRAANGAALLANDMHLGLRLPHVWYRARLIVTGAEARDLVGVTLPGCGDETPIVPGLPHLADVGMAGQGLQATVGFASKVPISSRVDANRVSPA